MSLESESQYSGESDERDGAGDGMEPSRGERR